jgi:hypothetical protein
VVLSIGAGEDEKWSSRNLVGIYVRDFASVSARVMKRRVAKGPDTPRPLANRPSTEGYIRILSLRWNLLQKKIATFQP